MTAIPINDTANDCRFCLEPIKVGASVCPFCARDQAGGRKGTVSVADRSARLGIAVIMLLQLLGLILLR